MKLLNAQKYAKRKKSQPGIKNTVAFGRLISNSDIDLVLKSSIITKKCIWANGSKFKFALISLRILKLN